MKNLAWLIALCACSTSAGGGDDKGDGLASELSVREVARIAPDGVDGLSPAVLDADRLALAKVARSGDTFCPDCIDLDPAQCPAVCERWSIEVSVLDARDGSIESARPVVTVFPASYDHSVDQVELVALGEGRVGVGWLDCDNARCDGLFAKRSCTARYTTVELATGAVGATQTLYEGWFGDLSLAFEPTTRSVLAVVAKDLAFSAGIFFARYDETGATVRSPWTALGSTAARSPAILARDGGFLIVADDGSPSSPPLATPCTQSCDCMDAGSIDVEAGGLFAYHISDGANRLERIASGRDPRGLYGRREQIAVIDAGGRPMVATTQSIDRAAEIFTHDGTGWTLALSTPAPIPMWIGALGTPERLAWLGAQPDGEAATVQRLIAGIVAGDDSEHATLTEPQDRHVFAALPVATATGVTRTYLLQGVFGRAGNQVYWDHFELLAVDAAW